MKTNKEIAEKFKESYAHRDAFTFDGLAEWWLSQRKEDIQAIVEMCEKEREVPVEIPHGSPYLSGYNAAIDDIISSLKEKLVVENL